MVTEEKNDLVQQYRRLDAKCGNYVDRLYSNRQFEHQVYIPTKDAPKREAAILNELLEETKALPEPDHVFSWLKNHFQEFLMGRVSQSKTTFDRPGRFVGGLTGFIDYMGRIDSREPQARHELFMERFGQADALWDGIESMLPVTESGHISALADDCKMLGKFAMQAKALVPEQYKGLSQPALNEIEDTLAEVAAKSAVWAEKARAAIAGTREASSGEGAQGKLDEDVYRTLLRDELGIELDELLSWYDDEVESTREDVFQIASRINLGATPHPKDMAGVVEVLNRFAGPAQSPDEMFERMRGYLVRAQKAARELVKLPEEYCRVVPTPTQYRDSYPWGGYGGGCPKRRPLLGEVFLNDGNYKAITDGWIKVNAVHECYPGHHVQWVRATLDPLPETVKMGARSVPLLEGACLRTERLMEPIFPEDPFYPLFVAYRRHHTATRIKADLYLRYFGKSIDEVVDLYVEEMAFDRNTARGQVRAQEFQVGYFNTYYYGLKALTDFESKYKYSKKDFTELIFGLPHVSLQSLENFLKMDASDQQRILTGFPSMLGT